MGPAAPACVTQTRHSAEGGVGTLRNHQGSAEVQEGKRLFRQTCASCQTLAAVGARGVTGPNLDQIGRVSKQRGLTRLTIRGTGVGRIAAGTVPRTYDPA